MKKYFLGPGLGWWLCGYMFCLGGEAFRNWMTGGSNWQLLWATLFTLSSIQFWVEKK